MIPFWREFQRLSSVDTLGYPVSRRFIMDGLVCQATQKFVLQWRPEYGEALFVNVFDALSERGDIAKEAGLLPVEAAILEAPMPGVPR